MSLSFILGSDVYCSALLNSNDMYLDVFDIKKHSHYHYSLSKLSGRKYQSLLNDKTIATQAIIHRHAIVIAARMLNILSPKKNNYLQKI